MKTTKWKLPHNPTQDLNNSSLNASLFSYLWMTNNPQQPWQATRLQLQLNLNTLLTNYIFKGIHSLEAQCRVSFWNNNQISHLAGLATPESGEPRVHTSPNTHTHFSIAKTKKENKGKKSFKKEAIKKLSLRSKWYCFSHSRASRIQELFLSASYSYQQWPTILFTVR